MKVLILFLLVGSFLAKSASAQNLIPNLTNQPCLGGDAPAREQAAIAFLGAILSDQKQLLNLNLTLASNEISLKDETTSIYSQIGQEMIRRKCAFTSTANFQTIGATLYSLENEAFQIEKKNSKLPSEIVPGKFKAVISGTDQASPKAPNAIYMELREEGFRFWYCEVNTVTGAMPDYGPNECIPLVNDSFAIPADVFFAHTRGAGHLILSTFATIGQFALIFVSNLGINFLSNAAISVATAINPTPMANIERDHSVNRSFQVLFEFANEGNIQHEKDGTVILSKALPYPYASIKQAMLDVSTLIIKKDLKKSDKRIKQNYQNPNKYYDYIYQGENAFHSKVLNSIEAESDSTARIKPAPKN